MESQKFTPFSITVQGRLVTFDRPAVMGILNVTPDSFYDGGRHLGPEALVNHAHKLVAEGADIVDIGVVSSRPGATAKCASQAAAGSGMVKPAHSPFTRTVPSNIVLKRYATPIPPTKS